MKGKGLGLVVAMLVMLFSPSSLRGDGYENLNIAVNEWNAKIELIKSQMDDFDAHLFAARSNLENYYATFAQGYWSDALSEFAAAEDAAGTLLTTFGELETIRSQIIQITTDLAGGSGIPYSLSPSCCGVELGPIPFDEQTCLYLGLPPPAEGVPEFKLHKLSASPTGSDRSGVGMLESGGGIIDLIRGILGFLRGLLGLLKTGRALGPGIHEDCTPEQQYACEFLFNECVKAIMHAPTDDSGFRDYLNKLDSETRRICGFDRWVNDPRYATNGNKVEGYIKDYLRNGDGKFDCEDCLRVFGPTPGALFQNYTDYCTAHPLPDCINHNALTPEDALRRVKKFLDKYRCDRLWDPHCWILVQPLTTL